MLALHVFPRLMAHVCSALLITNTVVFSLSIEVYDKLAFILQETSLDQNFFHCPRFHTAASFESRPCLSSSVAGRSFKPAKSRRLGKLLILPTITSLISFIFQQINLYVLLSIRLRLFSTERQNQNYCAPVCNVNYIVLACVKRVSSIHQEPES